MTGRATTGGNRRLLAAVGMVLVLSPAATVASKDVPDAGARCAGLAALARPGLEVTEAALVEAGPVQAPAGVNPPPLPGHCLVRGTINRRIGAGGREFGIGFELRLPVQWNGRFLFQGGAGLDGQVQPAIGTMANSAGPPALQRGFAVVSTDSGHRGPIIDASFGLDQQARVDYAYNALDKVTAEAKRLLAAFYGGPANHSYFLGCSNGGRQAMMVSQRLPNEFDGVVAGDPAMGFSRIAIGEVWNTGVVARIAPRDGEGRPILARAFADADLQLVRSAVLKQCDALDGLADGMINDWHACSFDPAQLTCRPGQADGCLTAPKVTVLKDLFAGPQTRDGRSVYGPFTWDTGIASSAWRGMRLGTSDSGTPNSADATLGLGQFRFYQLTPADPQFDAFAPFDVDAMLERVRYTAGIGDADSPLLSTFAMKGKLIVYNGMADQGMATAEMVRWYHQMLAATGPQGAGAVRLFTVPGMLHCGGGEATDRFEMLDAIVRWVEQDEAPERIEAQGAAFPGVSRPLCPYPKVARYTGGNPASAASFTCRE